MKKETVPERVERLRVERGISASELARLAGVTPTAVWNWQTNGRVPRPDTLARIAVALNVTTEFLLTGNNDNAKQSIAEIVERCRNEVAKLSGFDPARVKVHVEFVPQ